MQKRDNNNWPEQNRRYLTASLDYVREMLETYISQRESPAGNGEKTKSIRALDELATGMASPPALETLCTLFGLTAFERNILLLCVGMELDSRFASFCAQAQNDATKGFPTFGLAMSVFPDAYWSALSPTAPLRYWRMIEVAGGLSLAMSPLRIDERIVSYLAGVQHIDYRLVEFFEPVAIPAALVPSHQVLVNRLVTSISGGEKDSGFKIIQLTGNETSGKRAIAAAACQALGFKLYAMPGQFIPVSQGEIHVLAQLLTRESFLSGSTILLDCDAVDRTDKTRVNAINKLMNATQSVLLISSQDPWETGSLPVLTFAVDKPGAQEQQTLWERNLDLAPHLMNGQLQAVVSQFSMNMQNIYSISAGLRATLNPLQKRNSNELGQILWQACRVSLRPKLDNLAQHIDTIIGWDDLVLPDKEKQVLKDIAAHVRQRIKVHESWGFAQKSKRGLGISALFAGASGTGKTMAAEVMANELKLDLYKIDLSAVVSKYIGETEKNLRRIFDAAEESGVILLFDEADALFGKRSEVKDSHDRYANIEVSYLLQRMEAYRGLAILTTNRKSALDTAFLRRIRFIVNFPFPDAEQRTEIWRRIFPVETPKEGVDSRKLAQLNIAGGNIRNIALHAAFIAADANQPVRMQHLAHAAKSEFGKIEKSLKESELAEWG